MVHLKGASDRHLLLFFAFLCLSGTFTPELITHPLAGLQAVLAALCNVRYSCREYRSIPIKRKCYGYSDETYYSGI